MIWILGLATLLVGAMGLYAKRRRVHMDRREEVRADFFDAAQVLAESDDTPDSVLDLVEILADHLADPRAPYLLLYFLVHGDARRSAREPGDKLRRLHADVAAMPPALQAEFRKLVAAGALAITFNSVLVGWLIRRLALYQVNRREPRQYDGTDDADTLMSGWACA